MGRGKGAFGKGFKFAAVLGGEEQLLLCNDDEFA